MENKILNEEFGDVIVEEMPEVITAGSNKGLKCGLIGGGLALAGLVAYKKVIRPMIDKRKAGYEEAEKMQEYYDNVVEFEEINEEETTEK